MIPLARQLRTVALGEVAGDLGELAALQRVMDSNEDFADKGHRAIARHGRAPRMSVPNGAKVRSMTVDFLSEHGHAP